MEAKEAYSRALRSELEPARTRSLARVERRLRGLTETERELLATVSRDLVGEVLRVLDGLDGEGAFRCCQPAVSAEDEAAGDREGRPEGGRSA